MRASTIHPKLQSILQLQQGCTRTFFNEEKERCRRPPIVAVSSSRETRSSTPSGEPDPKPMHELEPRMPPAPPMPLYMCHIMRK